MLDAMIRHIYTSSSCVCVDDEFLFIKQISRCCRRWLKTNRQLCVHFLLVLLYVFSPPPSSAAAAAIYFSNVIFLLRVRVCVCWGRSAKKRRQQQQQQQPREGAASLLSASLRLNLLPPPPPPQQQQQQRQIKGIKRCGSRTGKKSRYGVFTWSGSCTSGGPPNNINRCRLLAGFRSAYVFVLAPPYDLIHSVDVSPFNISYFFSILFFSASPASVGRSLQFDLVVRPLSQSNPFWGGRKGRGKGE